MKNNFLMNAFLAIVLSLSAGVLSAQFDDLYYDPSRDIDDSFYSYDRGNTISYDNRDVEFYEDYDYGYYSSRINRFHRGGNFGFYSPVYTGFMYDPFYYSFQPNMFVINYGAPFHRWNRWNRFNSFWFYDSWCNPYYSFYMPYSGFGMYRSSLFIGGGFGYGFGGWGHPGFYDPFFYNPAFLYGGGWGGNAWNDASTSSNNRYFGSRGNSGAVTAGPRGTVRQTNPGTTGRSATQLNDGRSNERSVAGGRDVSGSGRNATERSAVSGRTADREAYNGGVRVQSGRDRMTNDVTNPNVSRSYDAQIYNRESRAGRSGATESRSTPSRSSSPSYNAPSRSSNPGYNAPARSSTPSYDAPSRSSTPSRSSSPSYNAPSRSSSPGYNAPSRSSTPSRSSSPSYNAPSRSSSPSTPARSGGGGSRGRN